MASLPLTRRCPVSDFAVARAHVVALEESKASGERFIVGAGPYSGQHIVDVRGELLREELLMCADLRLGHPQEVSRVERCSSGQGRLWR